jgi:hydroxycarboxylate dehydrogenase B
VSPAAVAPDPLRDYCARILVGYAARPAHAERVAAALVDADLCGHHSHGVRQLPDYVGQIDRGEICLTAEPTVERDSNGLLVVDGRFGFGQVVAMTAVELGVNRAKRHGVATVAMRNANHIGRLGEYTHAVAMQGQIAILLVNHQGGGDQQVAPFGGIDRRLTVNPLSVATPGPRGPVVLDVSLSVAAESRVLHAHERGASLPQGWVLDADGQPSTDPADYLAGGTLIPVGGLDGGYKGYGLIVVTELLVGLLAGGGICGPDARPFSNAMALTCIDPGAEPPAGFAEQASSLVEWIKSSRRRAGVDEILLPGEPEDRHRRESTMIDLDQSTLAGLRRIAIRVGVREPVW